MPRTVTPNPALARLEALVGEWETAVVVGEQVLVGGRAAFAWIEGGAFLLQHADADLPDGAPQEWIDNSPFPVTTVIALDDHSETFSYAYSDGRGVSRVYEMRLDGGVWEITGRAGPEFFQRFTGTFSEDGATIDGRWERSRDGEAWELDFDLRYTRATAKG